MTSVFAVDAVDAGALAAVFAVDAGALAAGFVAVAVGAAADAGRLIAPLAAGLAARAFAAGFGAAFVPGFAAGLEGGFAALGVALAALGATLAAADRFAFGALDRVDLRLGAVADRRRVAPDPDPVDPVDVSSAIAFSSCAPRPIVHQARPSCGEDAG
jgi:hypothetical protein